MAFKQISNNLIEYYQPIILCKKKLEQHNEEYENVVRLYDDTQNDNLILKKEISKTFRIKSSDKKSNLNIENSNDSE